MMPDYFSFYEIPISFNVDVPSLKKIYYRNSRKYHPDFHTQEDASQQEDVLQLSTLNNKAFQTLSDFDMRMEYILRLKEVLLDDGQNKLPQDFLIEMMDINEGLMEVQMDPNKDRLLKLEQELEDIEKQNLELIQSTITSYDGNENTDLSLVKDYYLKRKYLRRIKERLKKKDVEI